MAKTFFMSDAHIGTADEESESLKETKLLSFFKHIEKNGSQLVIVGDLFDFWFEYRTVIPKGYSRIICSLMGLKDAGVEMHYVAGNHDFWMRDFLMKELNIRVHFDELDYTIEKKRFYIFHGDGLAQDDHGYRFIKKVFRNRFNIMLYSLIHPDLAIPFGKWISSLSRKRSEQEEPPFDKDYLARAKQMFDVGYDYVIFGHLHSPKIQNFGDKVYINLGDWIKHFSYAAFDGKEVSLKYWE